MNKVITVSREFGSGGRELGVKLAETLGIPFYDKELISMAADDINIAEEAFRKYDEHVIEDDPLDHKIHHSFSELYKVPMSDQIFVAQSNVIRRLASHGPCVIVGRCADMILEDSVNIFIYSKMKQRVKRLMELEPEEGANEKDMEDSTNDGFVVLDKETKTCKVRFVGQITDCKADDPADKLYDGLKKLICAVIDDYGYLITK